MNRFITCNKGATGKADEWPTKKWNAPRVANVGLILAGLASGPMVRVRDMAGSLIAARCAGDFVVLDLRFSSTLANWPMRGPSR